MAESCHHWQAGKGKANLCDVILVALAACYPSFLKAGNFFELVTWTTSLNGPTCLWIVGALVCQLPWRSRCELIMRMLYLTALIFRFRICLVTAKVWLVFLLRNITLEPWNQRPGLKLSFHLSVHWVLPEKGPEYVQGARAGRNIFANQTRAIPIKKLKVKHSFIFLSSLYVYLNRSFVRERYHWLSLLKLMLSCAAWGERSSVWVKNDGYFRVNYPMNRWAYQRSTTSGWHPALFRRRCPTNWRPSEPSSTTCTGTLPNGLPSILWFPSAAWRRSSSWRRSRSRRTCWAHSASTSSFDQFSWK